MNVLLVVDMQEAAVAAGGQYDLEGVVERINRLAARFRRRGGAVVFIRHDGAANSEYEPGTPGWQVASAIPVDPTDVYVGKTLHDAFHATDLQAQLERLAATELTICGWATDFCVDATVRSAVARGYRVTVASDCHTLHDRPHLTAPQVVEHHNWVWSQLLAPATIRVIPERHVARDSDAPASS